MTIATRKRKPADEGGTVFDRELDELPQELRWRELMGRIEAVLFARTSLGWWGRGPRSRC